MDRSLIMRELESIFLSLRRRVNVRRGLPPRSPKGRNPCLPDGIYKNRPRFPPPDQLRCLAARRLGRRHGGDQRRRGIDLDRDIDLRLAGELRRDRTVDGTVI